MLVITQVQSKMDQLSLVPNYSGGIGSELNRWFQSILHALLTIIRAILDTDAHGLTQIHMHLN